MRARITVHAGIELPRESGNQSATQRIAFYGKIHSRVPIDPTRHHFDSKFEIKTTVHKQAEWREKLAAAR